MFYGWLRLYDSIYARLHLVVASCLDTANIDFRQRAKHALAKSKTGFSSIRRPELAHATLDEMRVPPMCFAVHAHQQRAANE